MKTAQKKANSTRNRHTGRINEAKRRILTDEDTSDVRFSDGTIYKVKKRPYFFFTGQLDAEGNPEKGMGIKSTFIRTFKGKKVEPCETTTSG